jgi:hypothetical protein
MDALVDKSTEITTIFVQKYGNLEANTSEALHYTHPSKWFAFVWSQKKEGNFANNEEELNSSQNQQLVFALKESEAMSWAKHQANHSSVKWIRHHSRKCEWGVVGQISHPFLMNIPTIKIECRRAENDEVKDNKNYNVDSFMNEWDWEKFKEFVCY